MNETAADLAAWAHTRWPGRLDVVATAKLLGFAEHDIPILIAAGLLKPLGDPATNAPKWFAGVEVFQLTADRDWLHKSTKAVARHWRQKRSHQAAKRAGEPKPVVNH